MPRARSAVPEAAVPPSRNAVSANRTRGVRDPKWAGGKRKMKICGHKLMRGAIDEFSRWERCGKKQAKPCQRTYERLVQYSPLSFGGPLPCALVPGAGPALEYETAAEGSFLSPHAFRCHIH